MKVLAMAIEIGFIDYRSRFHISRDFYCPQWLEKSFFLFVNPARWYDEKNEDKKNTSNDTKGIVW